MSAGASSSPSGAVQVWRATIDPWRSDPDLVREHQTVLSASDRDRFVRFVHDDDRLMFLVGRVMARALVGRVLGCPPTGWRWREGPHGRPEIDEPETDWHFNIAHSAGLVVCALGRGQEVGVDVEDLDRKPVTGGFARRYLSPAEVADVEAQPREAQQTRLLTYWTLKEAYLKARGLGVSVPLVEVEFTLEAVGPRVHFLGSLAGTSTDWQFRLERLTDRHLMAVAASGPSRFETNLPFPIVTGTNPGDQAGAAR